MVAPKSDPQVVTAHVLDLATDMIELAEDFVNDVDPDVMLAKLSQSQLGPVVQKWEIGNQISIEEYEKMALREVEWVKNP